MKNGLNIAAAAVFVIVMAVGILSKGNRDGKATAEQQASAPEEQQQAQQPPPPPPPPPEIMRTTSRELAAAYEENSVSADAKFKGKRYRVTGTVQDINTDFTGDPVIVLKGGVNQFLEPTFDFDKSAIEEIAKLRKGSTITMDCTGGGDIIKRPISRDCELVK